MMFGYIFLIEYFRNIYRVILINKMIQQNSQHNFEQVSCFANEPILKLPHQIKGLLGICCHLETDPVFRRRTFCLP